MLYVNWPTMVSFTYSCIKGVWFTTSQTKVTDWHLTSPQSSNRKKQLPATGWDFSLSAERFSFCASLLCEIMSAFFTFINTLRNLHQCFLSYIETQTRNKNQKKKICREPSDEKTVFLLLKFMGITSFMPFQHNSGRLLSSIIETFLLEATGT